MSEKAPRTLDERTLGDYGDVQSMVQEDIEQQRKEKLLAHYNGDEKGVRNARDRANRRTKKLSEMDELQAHLGSLESKTDEERAFDGETAVAYEQLSLKELTEAARDAHEAQDEYSQQVLEDLITNKLAVYAEKYHWDADAQTQHLDHIIDQIHGNTAVAAAEDLALANDEQNEPIANVATENVTEKAQVKNDETSVSIEPEAVDNKEALHKGLDIIRKKYTDADFNDTAVNAEFASEIEELNQKTGKTLDSALIVSSIKQGIISGAFAELDAESSNEVENESQGGSAELDSAVVTPEGAQEQKDVAESDGAISRLRDWWKNKTAAVYAAGTVAALNAADKVQNNGASNDVEAQEATEDSKTSTEESSQAAASETTEITDEKAEKKRKWPFVAAAIGIAAVGGYMAWKYGISPRINGEAQAAVADAAAAGGVKLTRAQESLLHASGSTPWDRYADVYGPDKAATKLLRAVERLKESGIKVIEHGSGTDYWIEVPKASGKGFTSGVERVTKVLATGTV